jgi:hypothetical protein
VSKETHCSSPTFENVGQRVNAALLQATFDRDKVCRIKGLGFSSFRPKRRSAAPQTEKRCVGFRV